MDCPFCHQPAYEGIAACERCGFSLDKLDQIDGAIPRLTPRVCDLAGILKVSQIRRLESPIVDFTRRFPQSAFNVVTVALRREENLAAYSFWLFNRGGLSLELNRGSANHDLMLVIDPANERASMMIGYGLEPYLGREDLEEVLAAGSPPLACEQLTEGILAILAKTTERLSEVAGALDRTYGINVEQIYAAEKPQETPRSPASADSPY